MKYFLDQDHSYHWYLVPDNKRVEWNKFLSLDENNPESWGVPIYATSLGRHPKHIEFENPSFKT